MSGTSLDGVDGVLVDFSAEKPVLMAHNCAPFVPDLRATLLALNSPGSNELHHAALASNALAWLNGQVCVSLLQNADVAAEQIQAIGAHGQTVRHQPVQHDGLGYSLQLGNPALLAELTGIDVVADFRSRDVAAGGQGAPLVPAFHQAVFARVGEPVALLNLGGIANLSLLPAAEDSSSGALGFDCGPANALMDFWCHKHQGQAYDAGGLWARSGKVLPALLDALLGDPYLAMAPPKSTGRDLFNPHWLMEKLKAYPKAKSVDVQATLCEFTARICAQDLLRYGKEIGTLLVCGGGANNAHLVQRLQVLLPAVSISSTKSAGVDPQHVEAMAFAWLARQCMRRAPGNVPKATGAQGPRVLGAIYPR